MSSTGTAEKKSTNTKPREVTITPPHFESAKFSIRGTAPLVQNAFPEKARIMMRAKQEAGSTGKKGARRDAKDFQQCYEQAKHISHKGWIGVPATAFRNAMISACRLVGFKMTHAKLSVFVIADGYDKLDNTPLVRITHGEPHYIEHAVRNESGVADIRPRAMWDPGWQIKLSVTWDADQFTVSDVFNLLLRAGLQVGIGEGRPDSPNSTGMGWGTFEVIQT